MKRRSGEAWLPCAFYRCLTFLHYSPHSLCFWLAILSLLALLGHEIARSSAFGIALASAATADFEGFGDEIDDADEEEDPVLLPPIAHRSIPETNAGPGPGPPAPSSGDSQPKDQVLSDVPASRPAAAAPASSQDLWDEDEFEGFPIASPAASKAQGFVAKDTGSKEEGSKQEPPAMADKRPRPLSGPQSYLVEVFSVGFLLAYAINYYLGRKENEKIALAWALQFASKGSIFEKNFSLLGTGEGEDAALLMKEGQNVFKFYASGRRFCQGLLATMDLQCRHDLIARMWYLISPRKDEITIEVFMNEDSMDPMVVAIARKKIAKAMHKDLKDLQQYATFLTPASSKRWPSDHLGVISESRDLVSDLLTEPALDQVFGEKAFEKHGENFVFLHFSDQHPLGSHKKVLQFKYTLPRAKRMAEIARLIAVVPYFIDIVGRHRLNAQARAKADVIRAKVIQEELKESQSSRQQVTSKKKADSDSKLTPEALRKKEEKERLRLLKKSLPKAKMTRAH